MALDGSGLSAAGIRDARGTVFLSAEAMGGVVGALIAWRDVRLPAWRAELDRFARALRDAFNAVQTDPRGRDLDGHVGADLICGKDASDVAVALGSPRGIVAASDANPSGGDNGIDFARLEGEPLPLLGGETLLGFLAGVLAVMDPATGGDR